MCPGGIFFKILISGGGRLFGRLEYTGFFLEEYLILSETRVFLTFSEFEPQNILKLFLIFYISQLVFLINGRIGIILVTITMQLSQLSGLDQ